VRKKRKKPASKKKIDPMRPGMPSRDSIVDIKEFKKGDKTYRIIRTNEVDEYEDQDQGKDKQKP
jgi:hypothetical protein